MLENIYNPFWIEGALLTELNKNDIATLACHMTAKRIIPYQIQ